MAEQQRIKNKLLRGRMDEIAALKTRENERKHCEDMSELQRNLKDDIKSNATAWIGIDLSLQVAPGGLLVNSPFIKGSTFWLMVLISIASFVMVCIMLANPPLSEIFFGNIFRVATVILSSEERIGLVGNLRTAIRKIDNEYVKKLQDHTQHLDFLKEASEKVLKQDIVPFNFTSWCRFPIYEMDFGWGNPMWIGQVSLPFKNVIVFIDTKSGDGIEAWVNLKEEDMAKFESDPELLAYASTTSLNV